MTTLQQLFVYSALILAVTLPALCQNQRAVLYDEYDGNGNYINVPGDYIEDLSRIGFDNRVRSVCVTGIWLFYQDIRYNDAGPRGMEYVFGRDSYCVNIRTIAGTISSVRYAGAPRDYNQDSLTIYEGDYFQAREEFILTNLANLNLAGNHKSLIITGRSAWTVYDSPNFRGYSMCLRLPEPGSPAFINDLEKLDPVIPHGAIRSVSKGCVDRATNYTLTSFERADTHRRSTFVPTKLI